MSRFGDQLGAPLQAMTGIAYRHLLGLGGHLEPRPARRIPTGPTPASAPTPTNPSARVLPDGRLIYDEGAGQQADLFD